MLDDIELLELNVGLTLQDTQLFSILEVICIISGWSDVTTAWLFSFFFVQHLPLFLPFDLCNFVPSPTTFSNLKLYLVHLFSPRKIHCFRRCFDIYSNPWLSLSALDFPTSYNMETKGKWSETFSAWNDTSHSSIGVWYSQVNRVQPRNLSVTVFMQEYSFCFLYNV